MGEDDVEDISEGSFNSKSVWARMSVIVAGPLFNLILAWILCMIMIAWLDTEHRLSVDVMDGYSAQEQGLSEGDVITKIGGRSVHIWNDISLYNLTHSEEKEVEITYKRDGKDTYSIAGAETERRRYCTASGSDGGKMERPGFFGTLKYGAYTVKYWIDYTVDSLRMLVTGRVGMKDLSGPVGIVSAVDGVYQEAAPAGLSVIILNLMNIGILIHGKPRCDESSAATGTGWRKDWYF